MRWTVGAIAGAGVFGIVYLGMSGCVTAYTSPPVANVVDMEAAHWNLLYGSGTPQHPAASVQGWQFNVPAAPGSVHYVVVPFKATEDLTGKVLTVTFRMVSNVPVYNANVEVGESAPPSFHLFLERQNDDFTNEFYRWWCGAGMYLLGSQDNQTLTLSCPLTYTSWSSVYAKVDQAKFTDTVKNLGNVGVTFGGTAGWGHGVNLLGGTAQFQLLDAHIDDPVATAPTAGTGQ